MRGRSRVETITECLRPCGVIPQNQTHPQGMTLRSSRSPLDEEAGPSLDPLGPSRCLEEAGSAEADPEHTTAPDPGRVGRGPYRGDQLMSTWMQESKALSVSATVHRANTVCSPW